MKRFLFFNFILFFNTDSKLQKIECSLFKTPYYISSRLCLKSQHLRNLNFQVGSSTNWAGFVNFSNTTKNNSVKQVKGNWVVPRLNKNLNNTYAAMWIGIDGYTSPTVEQVGTEHEVINGQQVNYAWFEMYPRDAFIINNFPIAPDDLISASVTYIGNDTFKLIIKNLTKGFFTEIPHAYTKMKAVRSSAEWIIEAPFYRRILPLADFASVQFSNCSCIIHGITGPIQKQDRTRIRLNMVNQGNVIKAQTQKLTLEGRNFKVIWKHR